MRKRIPVRIRHDARASARRSALSHKSPRYSSQIDCRRDNSAAAAAAAAAGRGGDARVPEIVALLRRRVVSFSGSLLITLMPRGGGRRREREERGRWRNPESVHPALAFLRPFSSFGFSRRLEREEGEEGTKGDAARVRSSVPRRPLRACYIIQICPEKNIGLNFKGMKKSANS